MNAEKMIRESIKMAYSKKFIDLDDVVVVTAGMKLAKGHTNQLEVYEVRDVVRR